MIEIVKSKRRTISISIDSFGKVLVKAPYFLSDEKINEYILKKKDWINKHALSKSEIISKNSSIINKEKGLYFGKIVDYTDNFYKTIKRTANKYLPERLEFLASKHNFKYNKVIIKNYKSRWGTCYKNNDVSLNLRLVMLSEELIDYVILHELCHTVHFNHKQKFHSLVSSLISNEKSIRKSLKEKSFILKINY